MTGKGGGKSLSGDQNERVRVAIVERLLPLYAGNQSKLAHELGVSQSALSAFIGGRQGTSFPVALRVSQLLSVDVGSLLGYDHSSGAIVPPLKSWPGFAHALKTARASAPYIPECAWESAAEWRISPQGRCTPELLRSVALLVLEHFSE